MSVKQTLLDIGLNMFGMELFAESLLKNEKVREHVRAKGEPLTVSFPVRRSDCPGWAGVYITLWPVKEGETYPPPSEGIASVAADFVSDYGAYPDPDIRCYVELFRAALAPSDESLSRQSSEAAESPRSTRNTQSSEVERLRAALDEIAMESSMNGGSWAGSRAYAALHEVAQGGES